jgi:acetyl esterase/lipase
VFFDTTRLYIFQSLIRTLESPAVTLVFNMTATLDIVNQSFVDELSKGQPLYEKTPVQARDILETVQQHTPASDITQETIEISFESGTVKTVIFRPANSGNDLPTIFYTHGGGWILGRYGSSTTIITG